MLTVAYYALLELLEQSGMSHDIVLRCIHLNVLQYLLFCVL